MEAFKKPSKNEAILFMLNSHKLVIENFAASLEARYFQNFGTLRPDFGSTLRWAAHLALENIGNSDMLYHNVEHTMLVTSAGQDILTGKHLIDGSVTSEDWLNFMLALLFHDIGYVRGVCKADADPLYATGVGAETALLSEGTTDAALTPYHVSRGQTFVRERFGNSEFLGSHVDQICACIEMTRFPPPRALNIRKQAATQAWPEPRTLLGSWETPTTPAKSPPFFTNLNNLVPTKYLATSTPPT